MTETTDHLHAPYLRATASALKDLDIGVSDIVYHQHSAVVHLTPPAAARTQLRLLHWSGVNGWYCQFADGISERLHIGLVPHQAVVAHATARRLGLHLDAHVLDGLAAYLTPRDDLRAVHLEETTCEDYRRLYLERAGSDPATLTLTPDTLAALIEDLSAAYVDWTGSTP